MSNPTFYARIQNKYDTKANLDDSTFIPKSGELIGASNAGSGGKYKKLKIGDGTNKYSNLQFVDQEAIDLANAAQDTADEALEKAEGAQGAATNAASNSYINASISGKTITLTKGNGTTKTLTTQDTNTTYTFATGDSNGQIKVTPSGSSAQNISVKGLGSAAYTESSAYATSGHTHSGYMSSKPANIEFAGASSNGGFIDFHYGKSTVDYTSRIIENASGSISVNGSYFLSGYAQLPATTFTGNAVAYSTNRTTSGLRNIEVRTTSATGTLQSTNKIIMVRK